jgi:TolA-binding protein
LILGKEKMNMKKTLTKCTRIALGISAISAMVLLNVADAAPYRLQVQATPDQNVAQKTATTLNQIGYGPAVIITGSEDKLLKVQTKVYETRAEANFAKPALRGAGFPDTFTIDEGTAVEAAASEKKAFFGEVPSVISSVKFQKTPLDFKVNISKEKLAEQNKKAPRLKGEERTHWKSIYTCIEKKDFYETIATCDSFLAKYPDSRRAPDAKIRRAYGLLAIDRIDEAEDQFRCLVTEHPDSAEAAEAAMRLGYILLRNRGNEAEALKVFKTVASGAVAAPEEVRVESMLRCAALFHRGKDLDRALRAYEQVATATANEEIQALAEMQCAGLHMEQAWNGKSTFAETRRRCEKVLKSYPNAAVETRATAELMALETYAYENNHRALLERADGFMARYKDVSEARLGWFWIARAMLETGDTEGAEQIADVMLSEDIGLEKRFRNINVKQALERISRDAKQKRAGRK